MNVTIPKPAARKTPVHGIVLKVRNEKGVIESVNIYLDEDGVVDTIIGGKSLVRHLQIEKADAEFFGRNSDIDLPAHIPGIQRIPLKDGSGRIGIRPSPKLQRDMEFFIPTIPCWFEGCEELREAFNLAVARKQKEYTDMGVECPNCAIGEIERSYIKKLAKLDTSKPA